MGGVFIGLFTSRTFATGFLARCLGMGSVFAARRTSKVDGAPATGPTPAATGPGGTMCVPIRFLFAPEAAVGMVPPGTARAQSAARDLAAAGGADSAAVGRVSTTGGCGAAMGACAARGKTGAGQGEEIGGEGGVEAGEARAETSVSPTPRTR
jgi:hypothetical protein